MYGIFFLLRKTNYYFAVGSIQECVIFMHPKGIIRKLMHLKTLLMGENECCDI